MAQVPSLGSADDMAQVMSRQIEAPEPQNVVLRDRPGDAGTGLLLSFSMEAQGGVYILPQVQAGGEWYPIYDQPALLETLAHVGDMPKYFGYNAANAGDVALEIDSYLVPPGEAPAAEEPLTAPGEEDPEVAEAAGPVSTSLEPGSEYGVRLTVVTASETATYELGTAVASSNSFAPHKSNVLILSIVFTLMVLAGIFYARKHPEKLRIRRIAGLEAVEEAIGRATEMGKPVMQVNGLDPLTTLSTLAAVNILGQIARKVAHYDSRLMVPSFDPVVMTVAQETVKQAYMEEGRPDAFREEDIFFVTDQQFSYVASVCGIMLRERPAAIFLLGYFYAESLLLAETGQSTGAIQIAGTDAQAQLPFFITTCDYTLIGEELYAASAYLSREPMLLGGLKVLDLAKVIIMVLIVVGTILATANMPWLTQIFAPIN